MGTLLLDGVLYTASDVLSGRVQPRSETAEKAVLYSYGWLSGQDRFAFTTSGSTGPPRPIEFSRSQVLASIRLTREAFALTPGMTALVCLDTSLVAGRLMLYRAWEVGMNLVVVPPAAHPLAGLPEEIKIDFAAVVPYQLQAILQSPEKKKLNELSTVIVGGAPLPEAILPQLAPLNVRVYATYGMTETLTHIAIQPLNGPRPYGWFAPLPGITVSTDHRGCLVIGAAHLPSPLVTNDLVTLRADQHFQWLGRYDHVINSGGHKLSPEAIENKIAKILAAHGVSNRFFIAGIPHPRLHQQVVLVTEGKNTAAWLDRVWPTLRAALLRAEMPRAVWQVEQFAETASAKVNRPATLQSNPQPLPLPEED